MFSQHGFHINFYLFVLYWGYLMTKEVDFMNLYHLRYFTALAHLEHYTRAAAQLNITQPNLSYAINALEQELGVTLFEKEGRNVVLTRCGKEFLDEVEKSLSILDSSIHKMQLLGRGEGQVELGFIYTLGVEYIPQTLAAFFQTPEGEHVRFQFHDGTTADLIAKLKGDICDVVFCSYAENEPEIAFVPVSSQDLLLIVPAGHPLAAKDSADLAETLPYPQIYSSQRSGLRPIVDHMFEMIHAVPRIAMEITEDQVIAGFVAAGFGIALVPDMPVLNQLPVKKISIINHGRERRFYMAYKKDRYQTPAVSNFIRYVKDSLPSVPPGRG